MLFNFDVPLLLKIVLMCKQTPMDPDPGPARFYVLYLQDEHRSAKIDASRVISFLKLSYYNSQCALFLLTIFSFYNCMIFRSLTV